MNEKERLEIYEWCNKNYDNFKLSIKYDNNTVNRRYKDISESYIGLPSIIYKIKKRIEEKENITNYNMHTITDLDNNSKTDYILIIPYNSYLNNHIDFNSLKTNTYQVRFNVFISSPNEGCNTYYGGNKVDTTEGTYVLCRSSIDNHYTDINTSIIPRIALSFCYFLSAEKTDELCKDSSIGIYNNFFPLGKYNTKLIADINMNKAIDPYNKYYKNINTNIIDIFNNIDANI